MPYPRLSRTNRALENTGNILRDISGQKVKRSVLRDSHSRDMAELGIKRQGVLGQNAANIAKLKSDASDRKAADAYRDKVLTGQQDAAAATAAYRKSVLDQQTKADTILPMREQLADMYRKRGLTDEQITEKVNSIAMIEGIGDIIDMPMSKRDLSMLSREAYDNIMSARQKSQTAEDKTKSDLGKQLVNYSDEMVKSADTLLTKRAGVLGQIAEINNRLVRDGNRNPSSEEQSRLDDLDRQHTEYTQRIEEADAFSKKIKPVIAELEKQYPNPNTDNRSLVDQNGNEFVYYAGKWRYVPPYLMETK